MYHIFYIHSHITFVVAKAIIKKFNIKLEKVVFVFCRGYQTREDISEISIVEFRDSQVIERIKYVFYKFVLLRNYIKKVDWEIKRLNIDEFRCYVPQLAHPLMQMLYSHRRCTGFSIIEEGANCYSPSLLKQHTFFSPKKVVKGFVNVIMKVAYMGRIRMNDLFDISYDKKRKLKSCYTISENGFKGLDLDKEVVDIKLLKNCSGKSEYEDGAIFIFEGAADQGNLDFNILDEAVRRILSRGIDNMYFLKFHPAQKESSRERLMNVFDSRGIKYYVIKDDISMEIVFINSNKLKVIGFTSSLLYYGRVLRHEVFSFEELLLGCNRFLRFRNRNDFVLK